MGYGVVGDSWSKAKSHGNPLVHSDFMLPSTCSRLADCHISLFISFMHAQSLSRAPHSLDDSLAQLSFVVTRQFRLQHLINLKVHIPHCDRQPILLHLRRTVGLVWDLDQHVAAPGKKWIYTSMRPYPIPISISPSFSAIQWSRQSSPPLQEDLRAWSLLLCATA